MALVPVLVCDRCGTREDRPDGGVIRWTTVSRQGSVHIEAVAAQKDYSINSPGLKRVDLCPTCSDLFEKWVAAAPVIAQPRRT